MDSINQQMEGRMENLSLMKKYHIHNYSKVEGYLVCSICGKKILSLENTDKEGLLLGRKGNGSKYSVRNDRRRYFFPSEWNSFIKCVKNKEHRLFFLTCLHTGGRIMEVLNLRYKDIDKERGTVNFSIVKQRKAKKTFYATGKTRGFFLSSEYLKEYKSYIHGKNINPDHYIFLDNSKLPAGYDNFDNRKRKKYYAAKAVSYSQILKRRLKQAKIKDWYNFSPHNIRKTYGMWIRTYHIDSGELCYRMGHDIETYLAHYGSSLIFTDEERREIQKIFGEIKGA